MIFVLATQFHAYLLWVNTSLALCLNRFFNGTAVVAAFNMENVLVVYNFKLREGLFAALLGSGRARATSWPGAAAAMA